MCQKAIANYSHSKDNHTNYDSLKRMVGNKEVEIRFNNDKTNWGGRTILNVENLQCFLFYKKE